jgi:PadR family transcriptional regulator
MASLTAAHRGYEYQDLLVACRLVDMLLGTVVQVHVDEKLTVDDRFDDLSTIDVDGHRERTQFKHTENADRPLSHRPTNSNGVWSSLLLMPAGATLHSVTERTGMSKPTDLVQGTLDLLLLRVLSLGPMHGWAIAQRIRQMSNEQLRVGQSALYPALHKLEQQGWIEAEWAPSENNRRAKYYKLTSAGRKALKAETAEWERLSSAISLVVKPG